MISKAIEQCQHAAAKVVENEIGQWSFESPRMPEFSGIHELSIGSVVNRGSFWTLREIKDVHNEYTTVSDDETEITLDPTWSDSSCDHDHIDDQHQVFFLKSKLKYEIHKNNNQYCLKKLNTKALTVSDSKAIVRGMVDMCVETCVLSNLNHAHIIKIRAVGGEMLTLNYFVAIDHLCCSLEERISMDWRKAHGKASSLVDKALSKSSGLLNELMKTRLECAYNIATALDYLHERQIIFRNLKPSKLAFNVRDDIVLFDFGLARQTRGESKVTSDPDTWNLTGETGSLQFMAPEVALNKPYGCAADIYSFGLMLWQILKLEAPFSGVIFTRKTFLEIVSKRGARPQTEESWGPEINRLLASCWHSDLRKRPSASDVAEVLKREITKLSGSKQP